jgi:hypothetical protein
MQHADDNYRQINSDRLLVRQIKPTFMDALTVALAVYPEARVDVEKEGVVLHPSAPAVPRSDARRLGIG